MLHYPTGCRQQYFYYVRAQVQLFILFARVFVQEYDINLDGLLDREEFAAFIKKLTADSLNAISVKLIIALVVAPAVALMTKKATEGVPGVGKVVRKLPNSVYASIITLGVVLVQQKSEEGFE